MNVLVEELLNVAPQSPVKQRLHLLEGAWRQIWGPYDYRNKKRGVDPDIKADEIYQVIFKDGYYYNINPVANSQKIVLLRGEYKMVSDDSDFLKVRFTAFLGNLGRPEYMKIYELAALAETGKLPNPITIVPKFIVRLFFGGGALREVYTDHDLRITYGGNNIKNRADEFIYIMIRENYN